MSENFDNEFVMAEKSNVTEQDLNFSESDKPLADNQFLVANTYGFVSNFYDWIKYVIMAIVIVIFCLTYFFRLVDVKGSSMYDTLSSSDKVVVTNFMYKPQNNDIVVISHGEHYKDPIIKRVIATEGQKIKLDYENDRIIVEGVVIEEGYINGSTFENNFGDNEIPETVPAGKIFVMGDNRKVSMDSRSTQIGLIDVDNVIGKAQFVVFPFDNFGYLYK